MTSFNKIIQSALIGGIMTGNSIKANASSIPTINKSEDKTEITISSQSTQTSKATYVTSPQDFQPQEDIEEYIYFSIPNRDNSGRLVFANEAAYFAPEGNCIIYNYYLEGNNFSKQDKSQIKIQNIRNCANNIQNHEKNHAQLWHIIEKSLNGAMVISPSDRVRLNILAELCCNKQEKQFSSISDAVNDFNQTHTNIGNLETYYKAHYKNNFGSIQYALSAKDKIPEQIVQSFTYKRGKRLDLKDTPYFANYYYSADEKYQIITLTDAKDNQVNAPDIINDSKLPINKLLDKNGNIMKNSNGADFPIQKISDNGYKELSYLIPNFDKKAQGYCYPEAEKNYKQLFYMIVQNQNLSAEEIQIAEQYLQKLDLSFLDMNNDQIKETKETYANSSINIQQRTLQAYQDYKEKSAQKFNQEIRPFLHKIDKQGLENFSIKQINDKAKEYQKQNNKIDTTLLLQQNVR